MKELKQVRQADESRSFSKIEKIQPSAITWNIYLRLGRFWEDKS